MKNSIVVVLCLLILAVPIAAGAVSNPWNKKLPFKEATIHYELSGMEKGTEVVYIRDYGKQTAKYHSGTTSLLGMARKTNTVEITTPDWVYTFDLDKKTGTKVINPRKIMVEEYNNLSAADKEKALKNAEKTGGMMLNGLEGQVERNARTILGFSCDKVSMMGTTAYSIHDTPVTLLSDSNILGIEIRIEAIKVDEGSVDDKYFTFPTGIVAQPNSQADETTRSIVRQNIALMLDPDSAGFDIENRTMQIPAAGKKEIPPEEQKQAEDALKVLKELFGN